MWAGGGGGGGGMGEGGKQGYIHPKAKNPHSLLKVREKLTKKKEKGKDKEKSCAILWPVWNGSGRGLLCLLSD